MRLARHLPWLGCALLLGISVPRLLRADPAILVFGGGWGPEGTQASLESQVAALATALAPAKPTILFAAGDRAVRAVQEAAPEPDPMAELLGLVFDRGDNLQVRYRPPHQPWSLPASRRSLLDALSRAATRPGGLVVIGTGHGSPAADETPAALDLWGPDDKLSVTELAEHLDGAGAKGPTAFVLGQCHSGAFTALSHAGGDPARPLATPTRCVLAAVPGDREAAGCTPEVNDPGARAYIALFAEAARDREKADLDRDGKLTLAEAHAWARIHDETVDVPVSSSELWLEAVVGEVSLDALVPGPILSRARRTEWDVLERVLPAKLTDRRPAALLERLAELRRHIGDLEEHLREAIDEREHLRRLVLDRVLARWPELVNPYHRESRRLLAGDAAEVVEHLRGLPELAQLQAADATVARRDREIWEREREAARLERWVRAAKIIVREAKLRAEGDQAQLAALNALLACEAQRLR